MRSFRHWTPRYAINRIAEIIYHKTHPEDPWLTKQANTILADYLKVTDKGLEFGSGRSTVWFAKRVSRLISIEHNEFWFQNVQRMLANNGIENVEQHLFPTERDEGAGGDAAYVKFIDRLEPSSFDFVLVDGSYRDYCALRALDKIRPGGILIVDNVNWYLPSPSYSPASRAVQDGPSSEVWVTVLESISDWRRIWTTSGVTDTAFYFRPCA